MVQAWIASGIFPAFSNGNSGSACNTSGSPGDYLESYFDPFRAISVEVPGSAEPSNPRGEDFWVATANDGTLTWDVRGGRWSIVAMNADASQGVSATVTVGVETGILMPIGIGLIVVGLLLAFGAIVLIISSLRRREARHLAPGETPTRPDVSPPPAF
jgi:hypothetical protein